ncbi:DEAD/DEAH box helicase [Rossellomorea aquimaris]|uniref:DEAD/DEAH box helicase n=1 Tax=Rossellomorea aquimaris TaxID=189382 RepID=UPI0007D079C4|nr:AAA domain-containing protein [Rossellomorea aquimaris]
MEELEKVNYYISASKIASFFKTDCERQLLYYASNKASPVQQENNLFVDRGKDWEKRVRETISEKNQLLSEEGWSKDSTKKLVEVLTHVVKERKVKSYLFDSVFTIPESFYDELGCDSKVYTLKSIMPDLVEFDYNITGSEVKVKLIDIKSTEESKISHKVQVVLYSIILNSIINIIKLPLKTTLDVDVYLDDRGGVWTYEAEDYETFELQIFKEFLISFLKKDLPHLLEKNSNEVMYHVDKSCSGCPFLKECQNEALESEHISIIPDIPKSITSYLNKRGYSPTIPNLKELLSKEGESLKNTYLFKNQIDKLHYYCNDFNIKEISMRNRDYYPFPEEQDLSVILYIQRDPLTKKFFAFGILPYNKENTEVNNPITWVVTTKTEQEKAGQEFIISLLKVMEENSGKKIHFYFYHYSHYEQLMEFFKEVAITSDNNQEINQVTQLLLCFTSDKSLASPSSVSDDTKINNTYTIITNVIRESLVIFTSFDYPIDQVCQFLYRAGTEFDVIHETTMCKPFEWEIPYSEPFSHNIGSQFFLILNQNKNSNEKDRIINKTSSFIESYLKGVNFVAQNIPILIRAQEGDALFTEAQKMMLPAVETYNKELIARLIFFTHHESMLKYNEKLKERSSTWNTQIEEGKALEVEYVGNGKFKICNSEHTELIFPGTSWFLTTLDSAGWYALNVVDDFKSNKKASVFEFNYNEKPTTIIDLNILSLDKMSHEIFIDLNQDTVKNPFLWLNTQKYKLLEDTLNPTKGERYVLAPKYIDYTISKIINRLKELDKENNWSISFAQGDTSQLYNKISDRSFSDSLDNLDLLLHQIFKGNFYQKQAFKRFVDKNYNLLIGPPGTGKTHFIAHCILTFCKLLIKNNQMSHTIVVSAATNEAIEGCLQKLLEFIEDKENENFYSSIKEQLNILKFAKFKTHVLITKSQLSNIYILDRKEDYESFFNKVSREKITIVFTTPYTLQKAYADNAIPPDFQFQTLIVDEASQCKIPDALMLFSRLEQEKERILLVGDHEQLPPVIKGEYEDPWGITKSIFELLINRDQQKKITTQLNQNFRSNNIILRHSANLIYGKHYLSKGETATQTLELQEKLERVEESDSNLFIKQILSDVSPLVMCELKDFEDNEYIANRKSDLESLLIYLTVSELASHANLNQKEIQQKIFIICPHKAQITSIRKVFSKKGLTCPTIGTVDKMQGQQAEIVIISYAVADSHLIEDEASFIYSRNRLNVALTRGKKKVILFLSEKLFQPNYLVKLDPQHQKNIEFFIRLKPSFQETLPMVINDFPDWDIENFELPEGSVGIDVYSNWNDS